MSPMPPEFLEFLEIDMRSHDSSPKRLMEPQVKESSTIARPRESVNEVLSYLNPINVITAVTNKIQTPTSKTKKTILEHTKLEEKLSEIWSKPLKAEDQRLLKLSLITLVLALITCALSGLLLSACSPIQSTRVAVIYLLHALIRFRVGLESAIVVLFLLMTIHRVFGYLLTQYLQSKLLAPDGSYNLTVDWISLRIGLDRNEVIFHGLTFHNPPQFQQTPYFIRVEETTVIVDLLSLVDVFVLGNKKRSIHIFLWEFDGIDFYVEKGYRRSQGMNLWAALGAANEDQEKDIQDYVFDAISAASSIALPLAGLFRKKPKAKDADDADDDEQAAASGDAPRQTVSSQADTSTSYIPAFLSPKSRGSTNANVSVTLATASMTGASHGKTGEDITGETDEQPISYSSIYQGEEADADESQSIWRDIPSDEDEAEAEAMPSSAHAAEDQAAAAELEDKSPSVPAETKGWGVPYIFEVDRVTVHSFKLYAQDLLTAQHVDTKSAAYIEIDVINMNRRELTRPPSKSSSTQHRRGLYLDQLTWRLVYRTVAELFRTNQLSMMTIVAAATVNQTTNAVLDVAKMASQGVSNAVYNYNPVQIFESTRKNIQKVIAHKVSSSLYLWKRS
jgi:hypothetical protein